jgi:hypothetical protein
VGWVVRAAEAKAADLEWGYTLHRQVPGLYGFSVQYAPGTTVDELAQAGQFPNAQISYEDEAKLAQAVRPLGYTIRLVKSPGLGYHHTFAVVYDATGGIQMRLPHTVAQALASAFRRMPNPHRVPRRKP